MCVTKYYFTIFPTFQMQIPHLRVHDDSSIHSHKQRQQIRTNDLISPAFFAAKQILSYLVLLKKLFNIRFFVLSDGEQQRYIKFL